MPRSTHQPAAIFSRRCIALLIPFFLLSLSAIKANDPITRAVVHSNDYLLLSTLKANDPARVHPDDILPLSTPKSNDSIRINIRGQVIDSNGALISGASILIQGSKQATTTDDKGQFKLNNVASDAVLSISSLGYKPLQQAVAQQTFLFITLQSTSRNIQDVTVVSTGYQTISRERATGSFSVINPARLEGKLKPDLKSNIEGQAAGVVLTKEGAVEVRGVSTFNANKEPLIVVDGFQITGGLESINQDNIETFTILKDAVAASIYGAKSSNGVLVITTKKGRVGSLQIGYKGSYGTVLKPKLSYLHRSNSADYIDAEIELYNQNANSLLNTYNAYGATSRVNYLLIAKSQGWITAKAADDEIEQLKKNDGIGQIEKYLFRNQQIQQHNISLNAGTETSRLNAAIKYIGNQNNTIQNEDSRLIIDISNDWKPNKYVSFSLLSNVNYFRTSAPVRTWGDFLSNTSTSLLQPYDLIVNPATGQPQAVDAVNGKKIDRYKAIPGLKSLEYNPLLDLAEETNKSQNLQLRFGGNISVNILPGLTADAGGSWTRGNLVSRQTYSKNAFRVRSAFNDATSVTNTAKHYIPEGGYLNESRNVNESFTFRAQLNYNKVLFAKHRIAVIGGHEVSRDAFENNAYPTRFGHDEQAGIFNTFNYTDYNAGNYNADMLYASGKPIASIGGLTFRDNRFASWYANGSYEYNNRFLVSGSIRLDQTNFFGTDPKYRYKPLWSVGGTYKLSNEKFFDLSWIDKLYLRGSYGFNGNISLTSGPFLIINPGAYSALTGDISYAISSPPNNSLRWEKTKITNIGTDITLFKNRVNLTIDYYLKNSEDLLASDAIDPSLGFTSLTKNVGRVRNNGIELGIDADVIRTKDFSWNVFANYSFNHNKVLTYNVNYQYTSTTTNGAIKREGYPLDALFAYRFAGLDNNGIAQFYTEKNTKVVGGSVAVNDLVYGGTLRPKHVINVTNTFHYKDFDLSFMIIAKLGHVLRTDVFSGSNYINRNVSKRWRKPGDEATTIYPLLSSWNMDMFYYPYSNIFLESANYLKLRDVTLSYQLNRGLVKRVGLQSVKLYLQGRNLITVVANSQGLDPEISEINTSGGTGAFTEQGYTSLPLRPELYAGLSFTF